MPSFSIHLSVADPALREALAEQLRAPPFALGAASDPAAEGAAAIIVDEAALTLDALQSWRKANPRLPILLLGATDDPVLIELITENFSKPLRLGHLLTRLRYHLEVAPRLRNAAFTLGPYRFELQERKLTVIDSGAVIRLTEKETALLGFIGQSETPVTREELLAAIWGYGAGIDTHTLETHIYQLRRKLDTDPRGAQLLVNEQGAYRLQWDSGG